MTLIVGSLQLGLIYGLLAVGVYIAFRIMDIPDLSAEGTFTFGLAVSAALTAAGHPLAGVLLGFLAGSLGGAVTGVLQTKLRIHPILAGILTMSGLYSVNLAVMGSSSNISLVGLDTLFRLAVDLLPGVDFVILESNHDVESLCSGPYPYYLKQRILGLQGHLCNEDAAQFAVTLAENGASDIVLAHLSRDNNTPAMALNAVAAALDGAGLAPELSVAPRDTVGPCHIVRRRALCKR